MDYCKHLTEGHQMELTCAICAKGNAEYVDEVQRRAREAIDDPGKAGAFILWAAGLTKVGRDA